MSWAPDNLPARVGACAPCSQGKTCSCNTPCNAAGSCSAGGSCSDYINSAMVYPGAPLPGARVGAIYVSDNELNALGEQISLMTGDVAVGADKEHLADAWTSSIAGMKLCHIAALKWDRQAQKCVQEPDPNYASYVGLETQGGPSVPLTRFRNEEWLPFVLEWNAYRDQTFHEPTVFDVLRTRFMSLRDEWIGPLKQQTRSVVPAREGDNDKPFEFPWGWAILGTMIVLFPFYLPALVGSFYYIKNKGKAPILEAM